MELVTIARPYAVAVFDTAVEADSLIAWSGALQQMVAVIQHSKVAQALNNPALNTTEQRDIVTYILQDRLDASHSNFLALLAENNRLALLPLIAQQFEQLKAAFEQASTVEVTSARALSDEQQQKIVAKLSQRLDKTVTLNYREDPNLIGGVVIRVGDHVIDGSLLGRLNKLQYTIKGTA